MKVEGRQITVIESGNMQRKRKLSFDEDSLQHLMGVLTELYSDPVMAVIREYITNAYDSHVEANQTKPIEVSLPTAFKQEFVVRDYGVGMSMEELEGVYSKYGASTKRDSNDYVGMLGLGCKSGLAYADQFWVISTKDGKRTVALITRDEDGGSSLDIREHEATDEPDGFIFKIDSTDVRDFRRKAEAFLYFWKPGLVTLDGAEHRSIYTDDDVVWVDDNNAIVDNNSEELKIAVRHEGWYNTTKRVIVQGGVPYPVEFDLRLGNRMTLVHFAEIGAVHPAPPREALKENEVTKRYVDNLVVNLPTVLSDYADRVIADCDDAMEASKSLSAIGINGTFKGVNVPQLKKGEDYDAVYHRRNGRCETTTALSFSLDNVYNNGNDVVVVEEYTPQKFGIQNYYKLNAYWEANSQSKVFKTIMTVDGKAAEGLHCFEVVNWSEVNSWSRKNGAKRGSTGSDKYHFYNEKLNSFEVREAQSDEDYVIYTDARDMWGSDPKKFIARLYPDRIVVREPKNRHDKFVRNNPGTIVFDKSKVKSKMDSMLTKKEVAYIHYNRRFNSFKASKFVDPEIRSFLAIVADGKGVDLNAVACYNELKRLGIFYSFQSKLVDNPFDNYGVVTVYSMNDSVVEAINAIYTYRKDN